MSFVGRPFGSVLAFFLACCLAHGTSLLKPVNLPSAEGAIVGATFSPDSSRLAVVRHVAAAGTSGQRYTLQIVDLKTGQEVSHTDLLNGDPPEHFISPHFVKYSQDGRYLLIAARGSDVLLIADSTKLQTTKRIVLHPEFESRKFLSTEGHRYFRGVVSLAVASETGIFGVLTDDELGGNEIFVGSFPSGQIIKSWSLGHGRTSTQLGDSAISFAEDGSQIAVSLLPDENTLPKGFNNLRVYRSDSGELIKAIRTDGLVGQIVLLRDSSVIVSRIDTPNMFSKKACIEKWDVGYGKLIKRFCDQGWNVEISLGVSVASARIVGSAHHLHKDLEGNVYAASGRIDVWDMKSGNLVAFSAEIARLISYVQMSPDGCWIVADQILFQFIASS